MRNLLAIAIIGLFLFLADNRAWADDASLGRLGEGVYPLVETSVTLLEEQVFLDVFPEFTLVDVSFSFVNPGQDEANLLAGFPEREKPGPDREDFLDDHALHDFKAYVDGIETAVERLAEIADKNWQGERATDELPSYTSWYTFPLSLDPGQKVQVRNTFRVKNTYWSNGEVETGYILKTGALWAGPISKAIVEARVNGIRPDQVLGARPGNWSVSSASPYVYRWEFVNWEPDQDINMHFSMRPTASDPFWEEYPGIDQLLARGDYEQALQELDRLKIKVVDMTAREHLSFREAYALQQAGKLGAARALWEQLLEDSGNSSDYLVKNDPAAYYYLAELYRQQDQMDAMAKLYGQLRARQLSPALLRWLDFQLAERQEKTNPQVKVEILLEHTGKELYPFLKLNVQDEDGSLEKVSARLWTEDETGEKLLLQEDWAVYYGANFNFLTRYPVLDSTPGDKIRYLVKAFDSEGHQSEASGAWVFPHPEKQWGNPLGPVEVEDRVVKVAGEEGTYYELGGYALTPPEQYGKMAGYRLRAKGTVTDLVLHGRKVLVIQDFEVLDKGDEAKVPRNSKPAAKFPAGKMSAIGRLQLLRGDMYRLETGTGQVLEFSSSVPLSPGKLYLVVGSWQEDNFAASRILPLFGDLKGKEKGLAPFFVKARPFTLVLENRDVPYVAGPAHQEVSFRSSWVLNGNLLVDMLELAETLEVSSGYHPGSRVITLEGRVRPLKLGIEDNTYSGAGVGRHSAAVIRHDGRIYIPLRFILEHYGYQVEYDAVRRTVIAR